MIIENNESKLEQNNIGNGYNDSNNNRGMSKSFLHAKMLNTTLLDEINDNFNNFNAEIENEIIEEKEEEDDDDYDYDDEDGYIIEDDGDDDGYDDVEEDEEIRDDNNNKDEENENENENQDGRKDSEIIINGMKKGGITPIVILAPWEKKPKLKFQPELIFENCENDRELVYSSSPRIKPDDVLLYRIKPSLNSMSDELTNSKPSQAHSSASPSSPMISFTKIDKIATRAMTNGILRNNNLHNHNINYYDDDKENEIDGHMDLQQIPQEFNAHADGNISQINNNSSNNKNNNKSNEVRETPFVKPSMIISTHLKKKMKKVKKTCSFLSRERWPENIVNSKNVVVDDDDKTPGIGHYRVLDNLLRPTSISAIINPLPHAIVRKKKNHDKKGKTVRIIMDNCGDEKEKEKREESITTKTTKKAANNNTLSAIKIKRGASASFRSTTPKLTLIKTSEAPDVMYDPNISAISRNVPTMKFGDPLKDIRRPFSSPSMLQHNQEKHQQQPCGLDYAPKYDLFLTNLATGFVTFSKFIDRETRAKRDLNKPDPNINVDSFKYNVDRSLDFLSHTHMFAHQHKDPSSLFVDDPLPTYQSMTKTKNLSHKSATTMATMATTNKYFKKNVNLNEMTDFERTLGKKELNPIHRIK